MIKPKILIVDDEKDIRDVFTDYLELKGFSVSVASSGEQAIEVLEDTSDYDLLITDLNMPGMSGIELIQNLRDKNNLVPVIIVTGFPSIDSAINGIKQGATDYLIKPINLEDFLLKVNRIIHENKLKRESSMLKDLAIFLDNLYRISINSDLSHIADEINHFIMEHTNTDGIYFFTHFEDKFGLEFKEKSVTNFPLSKEKLIMIENVIKLSNNPEFFETDEKGFHDFRINDQNTHYGILPIKTFQNIFGGIITYRLDSPFSETSRQLIKMISNQLSSIIENFVLHRRMRINYLATIKALANAVDQKDKYTHFHSNNVMKLSLVIGKKMNLSQIDMDTMQYAALLHDIGKIGVPEHILNKTEKLTNEEYDIIKRHPEIGADIVNNMPSLRHLVPHIRCHHERIDGTGYPGGLIGEEIPLIAKIISVADTFEAMSSNRVYRKALSIEHIVNELVRVKGKQLDSTVVDCFIDIIDKQELPILQ